MQHEQAEVASKRNILLKCIFQGVLPQICLNQQLSGKINEVYISVIYTS